MFYMHQINWVNCCNDLVMIIAPETLNTCLKVHDLGVVLDDELTMKPHISNVTSVAFCHIRQLKKVRSILGAEITASLVWAFILNRVDYCNMVLANLPVSTVVPLQRVQNATSRLIKGLCLRDHATSALRDLH